MSTRIPVERSRQRGSVLFVSLILLVVLTLIGVTAARMQTVEERMAQNDDNYQLALTSAEATARDIEDRIESGSTLYVNGLEAYNTSGSWNLTQELTGGGPAALGGADASIADTSPAEFATAALSYNGPAISTVPTQPQFLVEALPPVTDPGNPMCQAGYPPNPACVVYRITTVATGGDSGSTVTVQTLIR